MRSRQRTMWITGLGVAAVAAAWMLLRSRAGVRELEHAPGAAEASVGLPQKLLGFALPRPRLHLPRPPRG